MSAGCLCSARWLVGLVVELPGQHKPERVDIHVWARSSTDAVASARGEFYGLWATAADRERIPVRAVEVFQEAI